MARALVVLAGLLIGSLFRPGPAAAQAPNPEAALLGDSEIQRLIAARVDTERRNLGIVVGIVTPGGRRIVSHGRASLNDSRDLNGDTVFEIGSVTKLFTSVLLADMVRRGEVQLTDSVFHYLPPHTSRARENRTITLADLATHTSGLPLWPSGIPATRDGALSMATYTRAQLLEYLSTFPVPADVGQKWMYSNVDAGVLGLALGVRANTSYEALLETRVTGPLNMRSTSVDLSDRMRSHPRRWTRCRAACGARLERANPRGRWLAPLQRERSPHVPRRPGARGWPPGRHSAPHARHTPSGPGDPAGARLVDRRARVHRTTASSATTGARSGSAAEWRTTPGAAPGLWCCRIQPTRWGRSRDTCCARRSR